MPRSLDRLSCLLLSVQAAWAVLKLIGPSSPIQARPGSDVQLPCYIAGPVDIADLAVIWKVDGRDVAKYEYSFEPKRPGALMTVEQLQAGNATLLLPNVQDTDAGVYTCFVILMPDNADKTVELKVEAAPSLTLSPTKLLLAKPGAVTCKVSDFYPGDVSVMWFRDGKMVKGPESPHALLSTGGLFSAESVLELTPQIADDGANISCRVSHKAIKGLLEDNIELQVQAYPILQILTVPAEKTFWAAKCVVSGFYPKDNHVQWLRNGVPQVEVGCSPQRMPSGTFSTESVIVTEESDAEVSYVCRVQHEALDAPLEQTILWQPKGEGDGISCPTPWNSQSAGKETTAQLPQPTAAALTPPSAGGETSTQSPRPTTTSTSPTDLCSAPGLSGSLPTWDQTWLGAIGLFLGLVIGAVAVIIYYTVKHKRTPGTKSEEHLLNKDTQEKAQNVSKPKTKQTDVKHKLPLGMASEEFPLKEADEEKAQDMSKPKTEGTDDRARHYQDRCAVTNDEWEQDKPKDKPNKSNDSHSPGTKREQVSTKNEPEDQAMSKAETDRQNKVSVSKL